MRDCYSTLHYENNDIKFTERVQMLFTTISVIIKLTEKANQFFIIFCRILVQNFEGNLIFKPMKQKLISMVIFCCFYQVN